MVNDCVRIGLENNLTSMKSLSLKCYHQLDKYSISTCYRLTAISSAAGILRNYRKVKRRNENIDEPYSRKFRLVACYNLKVQDGQLRLPIRAGEFMRIPLNFHILETIEDFDVRSITLTENSLNIAYAKDIDSIVPLDFVGVDRNLNNVTIADLGGHAHQYDLSKATEIKAKYREVKHHLTRNDVRIRRQVFGKYGQLQRNKVQQILHHASKLIVQEAKRNQHGIVMEKLTGIRKLYRKGNWQGAKYRAMMNGWSYGELQRQIDYKAKWEGIKVIYVNPYGTSSKCAKCGSRMIRSRKPEERRVLECSMCGFACDRDVNAAMNLAARGVRFAPVAPQVEAMVGVFQPLVDCGELASEVQPK